MVDLDLLTKRDGRLFIKVIKMENKGEYFLTRAMGKKNPELYYTSL